jgi:hypothetical protein
LAVYAKQKIFITTPNIIGLRYGAKMAKKYIRKMHIRTVNLKKWFPGNDILAAQVARLCILREDFLFELEGA